MTSEPHILSGTQATQDVCAAIVKAAGECLTLHGEDPNAPAILSAAFVMAIESITKKIDPTFKQRLLIQLGR